MSTIPFLDTIDAQLDWQRDLYRDFHRTPELSLEERRTADWIEGELTELGLDVQRIGGTGLVTVIENGEGPTVLARADIDALPITEDTGLDYASSVDGVMHACGHDMHIAALLGAVKLLVANKGAWSGRTWPSFSRLRRTPPGLGPHGRRRPGRQGAEARRRAGPARDACRGRPGRCSRPATR